MALYIKSKEQMKRESLEKFEEELELFGHQKFRQGMMVGVFLSTAAYLIAMLLK